MDIFHYCNEDVFRKIIASKKLWLTPVNTMNDSEEVIHLYKNVWEKAKELLLQKFKDEWSINILKIVDGHISNIAIFTDMPYCTCFSDNGDLLSQWRAYADDGKGYSICFDSETLGIRNSLPHPNAVIFNAIGISEVIYDFTRQVNILVRIVNEILNQRLNNALDWLYIITNLRHYSPIFKNSSFFTEQEKRIIYYFDESHDFKHSFVSGPYDFREEEKRFDLNWYADETKHSISKIILGPKNKNTEEEILVLLSHNGITLESENLFRSTSTYR